MGIFKKVPKGPSYIILMPHHECARQRNIPAPAANDKRMGMGTGHYKERGRGRAEGRCRGCIAMILLPPKPSALGPEYNTHSALTTAPPSQYGLADTCNTQDKAIARRIYTGVAPIYCPTLGIASLGDLLS